VPLTQALLADLANASPYTAARFVDRATRAGRINWRYGLRDDAAPPRDQVEPCSEARASTAIYIGF